MAVTLNSQAVSLPLPTVDFSWDPVGAALTFNFAGNSYPPVGDRFAAYYTPINQVITFTADATPAQGTDIVQYRWDMGDGVVQYGETVGHIYNIPNPSLSVKLEVLDNLGRRAYVSKPLLLQFQYPTLVQAHIRAGNDGVIDSTLLYANTILSANTYLVAEGLGAALTTYQPIAGNLVYSDNLGVADGVIGSPLSTTGGTALAASTSLATADLLHVDGR